MKTPEMLIAGVDIHREDGGGDGDDEELTWAKMQDARGIICRLDFFKTADSLSSNYMALAAWPIFDPRSLSPSFGFYQLV